MNSFSQWLNACFSNTGIADAVLVTFQMALCSTSIASVLGIFFGLGLEKVNFPGKRIVIRINRTLMGVPPVVIGLFVYMLLMRKGPLGKLELLFTVPGVFILVSAP